MGNLQDKKVRQVSRLRTGHRTVDEKRNLYNAINLCFLFLFRLSLDPGGLIDCPDVSLGWAGIRHDEFKCGVFLEISQTDRNNS